MNPCTHFCFKQIHKLNDSVAADVSILTAAAYSTLGVTTAERPEAVSPDVTVATAASANLSTAEAAATDLTVPVNTAARAEASSADVTVATAASANLATAEAAVADVRGECVGLILHQFIYDMN